MEVFNINNVEMRMDKGFQLTVNEMCFVEKITFILSYFHSSILVFDISKFFIRIEEGLFRRKNVICTFAHLHIQQLYSQTIMFRIPHPLQKQPLRRHIEIDSGRVPAFQDFHKLTGC